jgi:hypothetical protein
VADEAKFRFVWSKIASFFLVAIIGVGIAIAWPEPILIAVLLVQIGMAVFLYAVPVILSINSEGMVWGGLIHLPWDDIHIVRYTKYLGSPYLIIYKRKWIKWRIPLNLRGTETVGNAITRFAPEGHKIHAQLQIHRGT